MGLVSHYTHTSSGWEEEGGGALGRHYSKVDLFNVEHYKQHWYKKKLGWCKFVALEYFNIIVYFKVRFKNYGNCLQLKFLQKLQIFGVKSFSPEVIFVYNLWHLECLL